MRNELRDEQRSRVSELIADRIGLHFPADRWGELQRGLQSAARELGFNDVQACVGWMLSSQLTRDEVQVLATHLTIGETYFLRDPATFQALADHILPDLIRSRRGRDQRLRLWSAGSCSGEEPYSLAILMHQLLPDLRAWHVTITATDINPHFVSKAMAGIYSEWSFRNAPPHFKERYFTPEGKGRFAINPEIKKLVTFAHLNLVEDVYPSLETDTNAMDIIFCRNVLMYFAPDQAAKVIANFRRALVEGGWLAVSPSEASAAMFPRFTPVNFSGAILFRKVEALPAAKPLAFPPWIPAVEPASDLPVQPIVEKEPPDALTTAQSLYRQGRYEESVAILLEQNGGEPNGTAAFSLLARALANLGRLSDAFSWCERWIRAERTDAVGHYVCAVILAEQGHTDEARASLQRALYLDLDFALAHFALANLERSEGRKAQAERHFANALELLRGFDAEELLPESDGLTAGRLAETITSLMHPGGAA